MKLCDLTPVFYESPRRLVKTLEQFAEVFGPERPCSVAREISKLHEEHVRGSLAEVLAHFQAVEPKGEITAHRIPLASTSS